MRFALGLLLLSAACGPQRRALVSPSDAADLSREYHDRVVVLGIKRPSRPLEPLIGALIDDGDAVVVARNERRELDPEDKVMLRIEYAEGDRALNGGIVHEGRSYEKIAGGIALTVLGAAAFAGTVVGAMSNCVRPPPASAYSLFGGFDDLGYGLCVVGWGTLSLPALAMSVAGIVLTIRGSMKTNLSVTPVVSSDSAGASLLLRF